MSSQRKRKTEQDDLLKKIQEASESIKKQWDEIEKKILKNESLSDYQRNLLQEYLDVRFGQGPNNYADYLTWDDDQMRELINGQVFLMSSPSANHQRVSRRLSSKINEKIEGNGAKNPCGCEMFTAPFDVTFPKEEVPENTKNVVIPDIFIVCDPNKVDAKRCNGTPDFIIEILSKSSQKMIDHDRKIKLELYEFFKVKEYWIVDTDEKTVEVFILNKDGKYDQSQVYKKDDDITITIQPCLEIKVKLKEVFI